MGRFDRDALAHLSRQGYAETLAYIHCAIACVLSSSMFSASSIYAGGSSDSVFDGIFAGKLCVPCSSMSVMCPFSIRFVCCLGRR